MFQLKNSHCIPRRMGINLVKSVLQVTFYSFQADLPTKQMLQLPLYLLKHYNQKQQRFDLSYPSVNSKVESSLELESHQEDLAC